MRLIFSKIESTKDYIEVSYDNGKSWTTYNKANALANGITFTEEQCSDIGQIRFNGGIKKPSDISVKVCIGNAFSESYVVDSDGVFRFNGDIIIPDSATSIGERVFYDCNKITSVTIGNSVTSIGEDAFHGCGAASITIPSSVTNIYENRARKVLSL